MKNYYSGNGTERYVDRQGKTTRWARLTVRHCARWKKGTLSRTVSPYPSYAYVDALICGGLIKLFSASYVAGRHPASAQSSPLTAAFVSIKQMASAISSGLISRFNCVCGSTLVRM